MKKNKKNLIKNILPRRIIDLLNLTLDKIFQPKDLLARIRIKIMKKFILPDPNNRFLNLGGGKWYYPKWENVDFYQSGVFVDYKIDFREKKSLPFSDNCVNAIFTSHVLEHLDDESLIFLLKECYRILKPKGILRISVPDMDKAMEAYKNNNYSFFEKGGVACKVYSIERKLVNYFASYKIGNFSGGPIVPKNLVKDKIKSLDKYAFAKWCISLIPKNVSYKGHVNAYDFQRIKKFLNETRFIKVLKSSYRESKLETMRAIEFDNRPIVSLYVEAFK